MTEASAHDKQVKDLVRTEIFVPGIEQRELHCVNNASDRVNDTAGQEPEKCPRNQGSYDLPDGGQADPAHGDIDAG